MEKIEMENLMKVRENLYKKLFRVGLKMGYMDDSIRDMMLEEKGKLGWSERKIYNWLGGKELEEYWKDLGGISGWFRKYGG